MKFVSLRRERTYRQGNSEKPCSARVESFTKPTSLPHQIRTFTQLLQQIHHELRIQHPEWVQPNGESPMCDAYEARLTKLLDASTRRASNGSQRGRTI
jgi:hypothetical protein